MSIYPQDVSLLIRGDIIAIVDPLMKDNYFRIDGQFIAIDQSLFYVRRRGQGIGDLHDLVLWQNIKTQGYVLFSFPAKHVRTGTNKSADCFAPVTRRFMLAGVAKMKSFLSLNLEYQGAMIGHLRAIDYFELLHFNILVH